MYLEKLEVQGFKSFANKNELIFPGMLDETKRGITSIVGPNGSGKSNIADAIRWVLGEQSMKTLRGKKGEDVIFSGSDKKSKLGMAEVSLFFNNTDKQAPIEYTDLVITRRLFRSGDSDYLINGSKVRLSDIQMLLAKANVGQKTYSVIGQGMVEGFLNTTLAERKEFFDEATGVKQFQIKRDSSLNKLRASYENLDQVSMLLNEIEPRLKSLTRQVGKLRKRGELEEELRHIQLVYYGNIWHDIKTKFNSYNSRYLELEKAKMDKEKKLEVLNNELENIEKQTQNNNNLEEWRNELNALQIQKDVLVRDIARIDAQIEMKLEASGNFDLSWLNNKKEELIREIDQISKNIELIKPETIILENRAKELAGERERLDLKLREYNNQIINTSQEQGIGNDVQINNELRRYLDKLESLDQESDVNKIKDVINSIKKEIIRILENLDGSLKKEASHEIARLQNEIFLVSENKEKLLNEISEINIQISSKHERLILLNEKVGQIKSELINIENKINQNTNTVSDTELEMSKNTLKTKLEELNQNYQSIRQKIDLENSREEEERAKIFSVQRNVQVLQNEINELNRELGELKVNSTRYETKLEDLEIEIRDSLGGLKEVKESKPDEAMDIESSKIKINDLRHQLELIGGIDPETEKEYDDTKERFDFLSGQVLDLRNAIKSLEEVIKELDITIKEKFDKEFKQIQGKFEEYFKILFNGGNAKIIKVMDEDIAKEEKAGENNPIEKQLNETERAEQDVKRLKFLQKHNATGLAGIEIQATPPGKKIQSISMLSGGERALTAIALICAIISANPSPFVVLDEVDAALDEANSERLAKILDDLSHRTQFIVITHNRANMRRANILYGVTMQDDGVSKLVSVKLEDVKAR